IKFLLTFSPFKTNLSLQSKPSGGSTMARSLGRSLSIVSMLVFLTAVGRAEIFTAYLTPAQEVPPSGTGASGYARVIVNESAGSLTFIVVFNNLSSTQTLSHIHA